MTIQTNPVRVRRFVRWGCIRDLIIHEAINSYIHIDYMEGTSSVKNFSNWKHNSNLRREIELLIMLDWEEVDLETKNGESILDQIESDIKDKESPSGNDIFSIDLLEN